MTAPAATSELDRPVRLDDVRPDAAPRSVYVHAPFCVRRCFYCDFAVDVARAPGIDAWLEALERDWAAVRDEGPFAPDGPLRTLYVGGGTPSLLGAAAMGALARLLGSRLLAEADLEWTAEANPESFTPEVARAWRAAGVNRVSLGVQTFHEPTLSWMGRSHGADGAARAVRTARAAGFDNVSVDLVFGLPSRLGRDWTGDLSRALELEPEHVSLYGLTVESGTPLGRAVSEGRERVAGEERYRDEFLEAARALTAAGLEHYEVSNFCRPGRAARHNVVYWTGRPYLGLGNSAHSYRHPVRRWNVRSWEAYRSAALAGRSTVADRETLDAAASVLERIWLGLRTRAGLDVSSLPGRAAAVLARWRRAGLATEEGAAVRLTTPGWLVLDQLAVELDAVAGALTARPGGSD